MAKRIVIKIGNIFCAEICGKYKSYFQYIANDMTQLNSSVIRVFKRRYPLDANPKMEDVVSDEVCFYAHAVLRWGIELGIWSKVGKSMNIGQDELEKVWFGQAMDTYWDKEAWNWISCPPSENLKIWHINQKSIWIGLIKENEHYYVEYGAVVPAISIVERFQYGHYLGTKDIY